MLRKLRIMSVTPGHGPGSIGVEITAYNVGIDEGNTGTITGHVTKISYSYVRRLLQDRSVYAEYLNLAGLSHGQIVPAVGYLYRVRSWGALTELEWIPEKDLPTGVTPVQRDSLFLPYHKNGRSGTSFHLPQQWQAFLKCVGVEREANGTGDPVAEVAYGKYPPLENSGPVKVRAGDVLVLPAEGAFAVRSVVPPDPKTKVVGWVELAAKPIPEADLANDKRTIVRFPPPKK